MAYLFFIDESGQDQKHSPYEVLASVAVEDIKLWPMIQELQKAEEEIFGVRYTASGGELKGKKILKKKTFKHANQMKALDADVRKKFAHKCILDGEHAGRLEITALAQAKIEYVKRALNICLIHDCKFFASILNNKAVRPHVICKKCELLRKDYTFLFERFFYFLDDNPNSPCGIVVFDELEKSQSHILIEQMDKYFKKSQKGRERSIKLIPEPFFVHSDLTTGVQVADLVAYIVSWGFRLPGMSEPAREELKDLVESVCELRYKTQQKNGYGKEYTSWSFFYVESLCETLEKQEDVTACFRRLGRAGI